MNERYVVSFECNEAARDNIIPLLKYFEMMCDLGGTRDFNIDGTWFTIDGDGPDRVMNIKVRKVDA